MKAFLKVFKLINVREFDDTDGQVSWAGKKNIADLQQRKLTC